MDKRSLIRYGYLRLGIASLFAYIFSSNYAIAEIIPDGTLPNNSSVRTQNNIQFIEGGTQTGNNLFHSFKEFSVPNKGTAFFNNPINTDIQNIISRVTGKSISNIDGLIRTNGSANLFLLNPNGIVFGQNARLNIGGSFLASTANSLKFADGRDFSTNTPESQPLLSINVPIGLQFGTNTGDIRVQGIGGSLSRSQGLGLVVPYGKTLALLGGNLTVEGAYLHALGGRIELGSVAGAGQVNLNSNNQGWTFNYQNAQNFGNIQIYRSLVDIALERGTVQSSQEKGAISLRASLLNISGASVVRANTFTSGLGGDINIDVDKLDMRDFATVSSKTFNSGVGGNVTVNASESVTITGRSNPNSFVTNLSTEVDTFLNEIAIGKGGTLTINTKNLILQNGGLLSTSTSSVGKAGDLIIRATDLVDVNKGTLSTVSNPGAAGDGGNLTIETGKMIARNGGLVITSTFTRGNAGNLFIRASDALQISGAFVNTLVAPQATGQGGNLTIETGRLIIQERSQVATGTLGIGNAGNLLVKASDSVLLNNMLLTAQSQGSGNAGNLNIQTGRLILENGAQVATTSIRSGQAGNLVVKADESVTVSGVSSDNQSPSGFFSQTNGTGNAGALEINTQKFVVQGGGRLLASTRGRGQGGTLTVNAKESVQISGTSTSGSPSSLFTETLSSGKAGTTVINTDNLLVKDGAEVTVSSRGSGNAGNLNVNANSIKLDNRATLRADTRSVSTDANNQQATINLQSNDLILRRGSNITTNATGNNVVGGNINIKTGVLAALENSDISANSADFRGGNVEIDVSGIFGTQFREEKTLASDITASGATRELSGRVQVNKTLDPSRGLIQLPINLADASQQISPACNPRSAETNSSFVVTGRGGLPLSPNETLEDSSTFSEWVQVRSKPGNSSLGVEKRPTEISTNISNNSQVSTSIAEATGWLVDAKGSVILIAEVGSSNSNSYSNSTCGGLRF
ncbi:MAG: S-layer family protein [Scytonematopsis contorta HA4267-MV1]|jgi:filamentous hemagglutinin family protein|nr:S-layer family protein [Scytonematopsis contorta HA4267-MV1]